MPNAEAAPRWLAPALIIVLAALGAFAGLWAGRIWLGEPPPWGGDGDMAADLRFVDASIGIDRSLHQLRGEPVLINFWATWCPPCVKELPLLQTLHDNRGQGGLRVLSIAQEDSAEQVRAFLAQHELSLPTWLDPPSLGDSSRELGNNRSVLPFSLLLDAEGRIIKRRSGAFNEAQLAEWAQIARESNAP